MENTCVLTFKTMAEAEEHMDTGKHVQPSECESVYDTARRRWAEKVNEVNVVSAPALRIAVRERPQRKPLRNAAHPKDGPSKQLSELQEWRRRPRLSSSISSTAELQEGKNRIQLK